MSIDLNRGVTSRKHPAGVRIYMYLDEPGGYYDERGRAVNRKMARAAGFDVDRDVINQEKNARLTQYRRELDAEFASRSAELDRAGEMSAQGDGIAVIPLGAGGFKVTVDERTVTDHPVTIEEAEKLVEGYRDGEDPQDGEAPAAAEEGAAGPKGSGKGAAPESDRDGISDLM